MERQLAEALGVEVVPKSTRLAVFYRFNGQINWDEVDADIILERSSGEATIEVAGTKFNVDLRGSKFITQI